MSNPLPPPAFNAPPTPGMPLTPSQCTHDSMARGRPIPVTLTEAGLDSPTFRACAAYYADQIEAVERWLESATKSASKLTQEILSLEDTINLYLNKLTPPMAIADNMLDQDYTLLALKRVSDASREWWMQVLSMMRKMNATMVDPVRQYINGDLRAFKEARRTLDTTQRTFDQALARYASQNKTKEPSFLREEAFAVHETRKAYLKACMDFCVLGPQARASLDKLMVRQCFELAREVKLSRDIAHNSVPWTEDLDRIRGWSKEMEAAEPSFRRELASIRREISDAAILTYQPSRELEAYSASTVPFLGSRGPVSNIQTPAKAPAGSPGGLSSVLERQGWLFLKSVSGKPARTQWVRRWFYCRNGVFGSLQHNAQGVFQDDEVGVLLCSAKPAISEERRFCFEVKTKISALVLQAETQQQLSEWLHVFEAAKKQALETSTSKEFIPMRTGSDPAFSIKPPSAPEFSTRNIDAAMATALALDDSALAVPSLEPALSSRASIDVYGNQAPRRSFTAAIGRDSDDNHTHSGNRIMSRRDLHRKATLYNMDPPQSAGHGPVGGIAGLTSVSTPSTSKGFVAAVAAAAMGQIDMPPGSLAPLTPPRPPLGTNMTRAAIQAATDRSVAMGTPYQLPAFLLANFWGSNAWSSFYANGQLDYKKEEEHTLALAASEGKNVTAAYSPRASHRKTMSADMIQPTLMSEKLDLQPATPNQPQYPIVPKSHSQEVFPPKYPPELKAQHASFRLLFPSVPMSEKLVLVFRGAWSSTRGSGPDSDAGDTKLTATGRVFVTPDSLHFYGTRMGLLVAFSLSLDWVSEITAAPGKDCDYLFLHLTGAGNCQSQSNDVANDGKQKTKSPNDIGLSRITIKTFLENLPLLQARLNVLMDNLQAEEPMDIQDITTTFIDMECGHDSHIPDSPGGSVSVGSWEEIEQPPIAPITLSLPPAAAARTENQVTELQSQKAHAALPVSPGLPRITMGARRSTGLSTGGRTRGNTGGRLLPKGPSGYEPDDMKIKVCERHFEIGAKACFHVVFGDRSYIFARFYNERQATNIEQRPWALSEEGGRMRREFRYRADTADMLGRTRPENITDYQTIDMFADHATYVVSHVNTAWHLPFSSHFRVVTKMVITHEAKSRCKMAFYTRVDWSSTAPPLGKRMVDKQAMNDATAVIDALADAITDQVHKLGAHSRTKKAIQVYGHIGGTTQTVVYAGDGSASDDVTVALAKGGMGAGNGGESATGTQLSSGSKSKDSNRSANSGGGIRINGISSSRAATLRRHTLTQMAFDTLFSFAESIATSVLMSVFAVIRSLFRLISAHRVLLGLLVASAMFNVLMTSKDASVWWTERRAARFMQRVGIGPNIVMSRAVRWEDLGAAVGSSEPLWNTGSECYAAFQAITNSTDPDAHFDSPASTGSPSSFLSTPHSYETARRIQRTRQRLGSYRHDLLVAMRVINKIEREMEVAEWESWVSDENQRCAQLRYALDVSIPAVQKSNEGGSETGTETETETDTEMQEGRGGTHGADKLAERRKALFHWYKEYCGSCRADALKLAHGQEQQQQPQQQHQQPNEG